VRAALGLFPLRPSLGHDCQRCGQSWPRKMLGRRCGHNVLLAGSPGAGKSMLAHRLTTILPDLTLAEALETTRIHSVAGHTDGRGVLVTTRPFRASHPTICDVGLSGGDPVPLPGEMAPAPRVSPPIAGIAPSRFPLTLPKAYAPMGVALTEPGGGSILGGGRPGFPWAGKNGPGSKAEEG
jgi:hypothetical protein